MSCYFKNMLPHSRAPCLIGHKHNREVWECKDCGLVFCPEPDDYLQTYTESARYFSMSVGVGVAYDGDFKRRFNHDYEISEVRAKIMERRAAPDERRVLDVGCGNCAFVIRLKRIGYDVSGLDLNAWMLEEAKKLNGDPNGDLECFCGDFLDKQSVPDSGFHIITFMDSFEHFTDPRGATRRVRDLLIPGGLVVIETPDLDSDGWKNDGIHWRHVKPLEHPFIFLKHHIEALFAIVGMKIVDVAYTIPGRAIYFIR